MHCAMDCCFTTFVSSFCGSQVHGITIRTALLSVPSRDPSLQTGGHDMAQALSSQRLSTVAPV